MEEATCAICGKHFEFPRTSGRKRIYCSRVCANKARNDRADKDYWKKKAKDPEWYAKKIEYNRNYARLATKSSRAERFEDIAAEVRTASTLEEATAILAKRTRLNTQY